MDKTTNFDLPQWVKADPIKMEDFNAAFASIDAALKAEGDARSEADGTAAERITALAQTIANGKICRIKYGSYTGNGNVRRGERGQHRVRVLPAAGDGEQLEQQPLLGGARVRQVLLQQQPRKRNDVGRYRRELVLPAGRPVLPPSGNQMNAIDTTYYYLVLGYSNDGEQGTESRQKQPRGFRLGAETLL